MKPKLAPEKVRSWKIQALMKPISARKSKILEDPDTNEPY
jgi:hypothetical protein